jgi:hypothetical protein
MDLTKIGLGLVLAHQIAVLHKCSCVSIPLDTDPFDQPDARHLRLAERMQRTRADGYNESGHITMIGRPSGPHISGNMGGLGRPIIRPYVPPCAGVAVAVQKQVRTDATKLNDS